MKESAGEVFSIAEDNPPVSGCTISKSVHSGINDIIYFSLAKNTDGLAETGNVKAVRMLCRTTGNATRKEMTKDASLGYTTLAAKVKAGAVELSTAKGVYIVGEGE